MLVCARRLQCESRRQTSLEPTDCFAVDAAAARFGGDAVVRFGGEMSKLGEQLRLNDAQVREAERRLGLQHTFIARLNASSRDATSAQESLEVMRDILHGLYYQRSQLRRKIARGK
jgi:hypothetical protein